MIDFFYVNKMISLISNLSNMCGISLFIEYSHEKANNALFNLGKKKKKH